MKAILSGLFFLFMTTMCFAQSNSEKKARPIPVGLLDVDPLFLDESCEKNDDPSQNFRMSVPCISKFLDNEISLSEELASKMFGLNGGRYPVVNIGFIVESDSTISTISFRVRGQALSEFTDSIKSVLESSPKWAPGVKNDEAVRATVTFPYYYKRYSAE